MFLFSVRGGTDESERFLTPLSLARERAATTRQTCSAPLPWSRRSSEASSPNRCKKSVGWAKARRAVPIIIPLNPDGHVAALLCPSCILLNLTSGEIQEYPYKTPFSPLFGPFPNTAGSDLCNDQVIIGLSPRIMNGKRQGVAYTLSESSFRKPLSSWQRSFTTPSFEGEYTLSIQPLTSPQ